MKWILYGVGGLAGVVAILAVIGMFLPEGHRASRTVAYKASPSLIFDAIADVARYPEWRSDVASVEVLDDDGRGLQFIETGGNGAVKYRVEESEPDRRLTTRINDDSLPFGGSWTYEIQPEAEGATLTITEDGEVYNPIFRILSKFAFSPYATIDRYQSDLKKRIEGRNSPER